MRHEVSDMEIEAIEIPLLVNGIRQRYGYELQGYRHDFLKKRVLGQVKALRLKSVSELQSTLLHEPEQFEAFLRGFSIISTEPSTEIGFYQTLKEKVVPLLNTYPSVRLWQVGGGIGELYWLAVLADETIKHKRFHIYFTETSEEILAEVKQGVIDNSLLKSWALFHEKLGGKRKFKHYLTSGKKGLHFSDSLKEKISFFQHNPLTDSTFNEFNVVISRGLLSSVEGESKEKLKRLFFNSLCQFGVLGLGKKDGGSSLIPREFRRLAPKEEFYQRVS
jgi:chemotaxis protein methyltransferase CheR